jgi:hypothetical protein
VYVAITVILYNDGNNAKNDNESEDGDIVGNNGWCEYLYTEKLYKIQLYCLQNGPHITRQSLM